MKSSRNFNAEIKGPISVTCILAHYRIIALFFLYSKQSDLFLIAKLLKLIRNIYQVFVTTIIILMQTPFVLRSATFRLN